MQPVHVDHARNSRLRFVFDDAVLSCRLAANATFADIAGALGDVASRHDGVPVAVDVTFAVTPMPYRSPLMSSSWARLSH